MLRFYLKELIENIAPLRFILQSFLFNKYLSHTFSVYAVLILGLGAMFTRSYRFHDLAANTVYCGTMSPYSADAHLTIKFVYLSWTLTLSSLIFRVPYAPDDHYELDPFDL